MTATGQAWCWTEDQLAVFRCHDLGHDVREHRGIASPDGGHPAGQQSTFAQLRRVTAELGSALDAYGRATAELGRVRALLSESYSTNYRLISELTAARAAHADCPTRSVQ